MTNTDFATAAAHADLCRLLAACYYEPGPEFTEEGVFDALIAASAEVDAAASATAQRLKAAFAAASNEELLVDYARLFIGPSQTLAPPYESAWRDKNSEDPLESVQALSELYDAGGFALDPDFRDLPDHIAVELEFLYGLLFKLAAAAQSGDREALEHALALRGALLEQHLKSWVEPFTAALSASATCTFYRELAALTRQFIVLQSGLWPAAPAA